VKYKRKAWFSFYFRMPVSSAQPKIRISERKNKEKFYFIFFLPNESIFGTARDTKNLSKREEKELVSFLECEDFIQ